MDHPQRVILGKRRHLDRRLVQKLDENAAKTKHNGRAIKWIVDDAREGLGNAGRHGLDQHIGSAEPGALRIGDDRMIGLRDLGLRRASEPHAAKVALVQQARGFRLERDRLGEPAQRRDRRGLRRHQDRLDDGNTACHQRPAQAEEIRGSAAGSDPGFALSGQNASQAPAPQIPAGAVAV